VRKAHKPRKPGLPFKLEEDASFGRKLEWLMARNGITQRQLAKAIYVGNNTVGDWLWDERSPNVMVAKAIAEYFGVSLDWMVGLKDEM